MTTLKKEMMMEEAIASAELAGATTDDLRSKCCNGMIKVSTADEGTSCYLCGSCHNPTMPRIDRHYNSCKCGRRKKKKSLLCNKCHNWTPTSGHRKKLSNALKGKKNALGFHHTKETKILMSNSKIGIANPNWKGEYVGYGAIHSWVKARLKNPDRCESCRKIKRLDLANISQKYNRDLTDWRWLCRLCHMKSDGRLIKLVKRNKNVKQR